MDSKKSGKPRKGAKLPGFRNGELNVKSGDCILINPEGVQTQPYIGRVKEILQASNHEEDIKILVSWYYRPEEAVGGRKAFHGEKELFSSDHLDWCHRNTVIGKCRVHTLKKYESLASVGEHDYFTRFHYKPAKKEFEPDRVPVYCNCEMPYNPDKAMIMCDKCEEWYHPECLQLGADALKRPHFTCDGCSKDQNAGNKRLRAGNSPGFSSSPAKVGHSNYDSCTR